MSKKDYYEVLNLNNRCTSQDVKKNFHKLALVWHPDKHSDKTEAEKKFQEIHEAYCVLMDENKRKIYDTCGHSGLNTNQDKRNFNPFNVENFFTQGCFNNSKKSPFELFRDIFKDNDDDEDDDFYKSFYECESFSMPNVINKKVKTFLDEAFESSENEDCEAFIKGYKPTFMDTDFFATPSLFKNFESKNGFCSSEIFSSFFPSENAEAHSYSRTSSTVCNSQGNCKTSIKEIFQKGDQVIEKEQNFVFDAKCAVKNKGKACLNKKRCAKPIIGKDNKDFIVIEDSDTEDNNCNKANPKKPKQEKTAVKDGRQTQKSCIFENDSFNFDFNASDDDFNLLFANMDRLGAFKRNKK